MHFNQKLSSNAVLWSRFRLNISVSKFWVLKFDLDWRLRQRISLQYSLDEVEHWLQNVYQKKTCVIKRSSRIEHNKKPNKK